MACKRSLVLTCVYVVGCLSEGILVIVPENFPPRFVLKFESLGGLYHVICLFLLLFYL